jgi:hypothetical protein
MRKVVDDVRVLVGQTSGRAAAECATGRTLVDHIDGEARRVWVPIIRCETMRATPPTTTLCTRAVPVQLPPARNHKPVALPKLRNRFACAIHITVLAITPLSVGL